MSNKPISGDGWVSVEDRLPSGTVSSSVDVLAYVPDEKDHVENRVEVLNYWGENGWWGLNFHSRRVNGVTHWQPLPEPPKDNL